MKTKLLSLFVALICASSLSASYTEVDGIWYDFDSSTKTASVTYCGSNYDDYSYTYSGSVVIPETVTYNSTTYSVTTIGNDAFRGCSGLTSVTIPNSVTTIGDHAFYVCSGLTSVTIGNSVTTIGENAFDSCSGLTSVTIGNSVTTIGENAFDSCSGLTSVTIPNSVTTIGDGAFFRCSGLTSINVDAANTHYCSIDGILFNYAKDILMQYPAATTRTEYTIPNSVTTIGDGAFCDCGGLTSITIPNSVKTIGEDAFHWCSGLTSVTIPNSVTTIGNDAFCGCSGLTSVTIGNSVTTIGNYAFGFCRGLTSITIPNSVTTIKEDAFWGCSGLKSVYITNLAAWCKISFGDYFANPLYHAHNLYLNNELVMDLTIPNSVTEIGDCAFSGCSLTSITIPNSVKTIGDHAFYYCERICTVTFGSGLWEIGDKAFYGDYRIADITCYAEVTPTIYTYTFEGITKKNVYLYVPENVIRRYQIDPNWNEFDIRTKSADIKPITGDQATVLPSANDAILTWPISNGAYTYTITITKGGETICLLTFNAQGQLQNIAFAAPGHDGAHQAPAATLTAQGYQFTVTGLNPGTAYGYSVTATDTGGETLAEYKGNFSTTGGTGLNTLPYEGKDRIGSKYFHNGNLIIERNGVKYTATGQKVR